MQTKNVTTDHAELPRLSQGPNISLTFVERTYTWGQNKESPFFGHIF